MSTDNGDGRLSTVHNSEGSQCLLTMEMVECLTVH